LRVLDVDPLSRLQERPGVGGPSVWPKNWLMVSRLIGKLKTRPPLTAFTRLT
jgi:hypothetical protein